jgi:hypothetical protein
VHAFISVILERNKQVRRIGKDKSNNTLGLLVFVFLFYYLLLIATCLSAAQDAPRVSGPIDGQRFTNARLYEVNSMQNAIKSARYCIVKYIKREAS